LRKPRNISARRCAWRKDSADWVGLGQCFAIQGDYQTARDFYQKAIENTPDSPEPVFRHLLAGREFQLGTAYQDWLTNSLPSRMSIDSTPLPLISARSIFIPNMKTRARTWPRCGWKRAISRRDGAMPDRARQNPDSAPALKNLGKAYFILGQFDSALVEYNQALAVDPTDADTLASIGGILARQGRYDQAIADFPTSYPNRPPQQIALHNLQEALRQKSRIQP